MVALAWQMLARRGDWKSSGCFSLVLGAKVAAIGPQGGIELCGARMCVHGRQSPGRRLGGRLRGGCGSV